MDAEEALTEIKERPGEAFLKEALEKSGMGLRKEIVLTGCAKVGSLAMQFLNVLDNKEEGPEVMEFKAMLNMQRFQRNQENVV